MHGTDRREGNVDRMRYADRPPCGAGQRAGRAQDDEEEPREERTEGVDRITFDLLRTKRIVVISEEVSHRLSRRVIPQLLWLDSVSQDPIIVLINTPGGTADDGFAIHDILRFISAPVYAVCTGLTASAGAIILLAAPPERRLAMPNSRIMIHQPAGGARGRASDIEITAREIARLRSRANKLIAEECGKSPQQVEADTSRDKWMTPEEAKEYGLISRVIQTWSEVIPS